MQIAYAALFYKVRFHTSAHAYLAGPHRAQRACFSENWMFINNRKYDTHTHTQLRNQYFMITVFWFYLFLVVHGARWIVGGWWIPKLSCRSLHNTAFACICTLKFKCWSLANPFFGNPRSAEDPPSSVDYQQIPQTNNSQTIACQCCICWYARYLFVGEECLLVNNFGELSGMCSAGPFNAYLLLLFVELHAQTQVGC